jgi:two-component system, sensor histidine kinase and response regulator
MDSARILVVEDEAITALDIKTRLARAGYSIVGVARSGRDAVSQAASARPDLVLMDVQLRDSMDGIEAADIIRRELDIPVIYLTAYADDDTLQRARLTEPFGYLLKPFEQRELHSTIAMALQKHKSEVAVRESEQRMRLYATRLSILHEIDRAILAAGAPEVIAVAALQHIQSLVPCCQASVGAFDLDTGRASILAMQFAGDVRVCMEDHAALARIDDLEALKRGQPIVVDDLLALSQPDTMGEALIAAGVRSSATVPLLAQGELIGTFQLGAAETGAYGSEPLEIIQEVAGSLALAIHHARVLRQVAQHAAELQERTEELNAFAHTVAHEIQNPLALIIGFTDLLLDETDPLPEPALRRSHQTIFRTAAKMNDMVREMLLLAAVRTQDVPCEPLDMAPLVDSACRRLVRLVDETHAEILQPTAWPAAKGYGPWIEQVWANYLSNALKYGGRPARVELGAHVEPDGWVRFWVHDNGLGILPEVQPQLFAPFTRLGQVRAEGQGLGLSIVRRIVEKLGGQVAVESSGVPGQGSTFSFTLPGAADQAGGSA